MLAEESKRCLLKRVLFLAAKNTGLRKVRDVEGGKCKVLAVDSTEYWIKKY
jgi:hypothetical protein